MTGPLFVAGWLLALAQGEPSSVYLDVHGQPNGTKIVLMDHYSWPRP